MTGTLFLLPTPLSANEVHYALPPYNLEVVKTLKVFFVENKKTARQFLKNCGVPSPYDDLELNIFDKNTDLTEEVNQLWPMLKGQDAGFLSEAGIPGLADPGAGLVAACHRQGIPVKPLVGPSSVPLALSASGLNGQAFTFHGYLPIQQKDRRQQLKKLEKTALETGYTQVFMETPYRNDQLLATLIKSCRPTTLLCIAADLTSKDETITTLSIGEWQTLNPTYHKRPAIFAMGKVQ
jgi:16S rRNA (cytidine1402-2'-O)-methyltransferase